MVINVQGTRKPQSKPKSDYIGRNLSIVSKAQNRYSGLLTEVDGVNLTLTLTDVRIYGTEDREAEKFIPPSQQLFPGIKFDASNILFLYEDQDEEAIQADPAIVSVQKPKKTYVQDIAKASSIQSTEGQIFSKQKSRKHVQNNFPAQHHFRNDSNHPAGFHVKQPKSVSISSKEATSKFSQRPKQTSSVISKDTKIDVSKKLTLEVSAENGATEKFFGPGGFFDNISISETQDSNQKNDFKKENFETFGKGFNNFARMANGNKYHKKFYPYSRSKYQRGRRNQPNDKKISQKGENAVSEVEKKVVDDLVTKVDGLTM